MSVGNAIPAHALADVLFEDETVGRCLVAPDGIVLRVNAEWQRLTGYTDRDALGRHFGELFPGVLDDAARAGGRADVPARGQRVAGREFRWAGSVVPVSLANGTGLLVACREVPPDRVPAAAEAALRDTEQRFRALTEAMPQIVCVLAPDGTPEYVNPAWVAFSGLDLEATARAGWGSVVHPDDVGAVIECRRRVLKQRAPQDVEVRYRGAGGSYRWFLCRLAPVVEGERVIRLVGAAMDIEDRRRAEQESQQRTVELEGVLGELQRAHAALRQVDQRKDEFLGMLSHELRNPLAPIRNSAYILRNSDPASERAHRAQRVIERQVEHLTRLVDDLLDVTRIARGKIELRRARLDLRELLPRAADDFRTIMDERGLAFRLALPEAPLWAEVDSTRLAQVVGNLLHNAAKFTPRGGEVTLSAVAADGSAELRVSDTGAGIEATLLPTIFDAFTQGERTLARSEGGLGLGLALVKGIAELHGGSVRAESAGIGKGSEIVVRLPLAAEGLASDARCGDPLPARARRVLVVDDNGDAAESLADMVRLLGHDVEVAYDGPSALEKARASPPDVLLCDIGLPGMSGYDVARALRAASGAGMHLFAVSGYAQPEDVRRAVEAGFDGHVAKPADAAQIERLLSWSDAAS